MNKKLIPKGYYCYDFDKQVTCPYWYQVPGKDEHENGYCSFLQKGDWELNPELNKTMCVVASPRTEDIGKSVAELFDGEFPSSLLFDQCKMCEENMNDK